MFARTLAALAVATILIAPVAPAQAGPFLDRIKAAASASKDRLKDVAGRVKDRLADGSQNTKCAIKQALGRPC